jgi:geranylgeranyl diphosphate/geranylgeranyl-bacteriochlorophyllide a reductase
MFDVAIIGAGPAGATLARLIGRDLRILLVDKRRFDGGDPADTKCCGGLLAPDAQRELAALDLGVPRDVLAGPQLFAVRAVDLPSGLMMRYQRHYLNVDRGRFDRWLLGLVPPQVDTRFSSAVLGWHREGRGFRLDLSSGGRQLTERCRLVVAACGASPSLRGPLGDGGDLSSQRQAVGRPPGRVYAAIQEWHEGQPRTSCFWAFFDPEVTDFYSWVIPKDGQLLVGSALPAGPGAAGRFDRLKRRLGEWGFALGRPVRRCGALLGRPTRGEVRLEAGGAILVGEAGGWISPSSGEGISYALSSGGALAAAIRGCPADPLPQYRRLTAGLRMKLRLKAAKAWLMYQPCVRRWVLRSGVGGIPAPAGGAEGPDRAPAPGPRPDTRPASVPGH